MISNIVLLIPTYNTHFGLKPQDMIYYRKGEKLPSDGGEGATVKESGGLKLESENYTREAEASEMVKSGGGAQACW